MCGRQAAYHEGRTPQSPSLQAAPASCMVKDITHEVIVSVWDINFLQIGLTYARIFDPVPFPLFAKFRASRSANWAWHCCTSDDLAIFFVTKPYLQRLGQKA